MEHKLQLNQAFCTAVMSSIGGASADDTAAFLKIASGTLAFIETMSWQTKHVHKLHDMRR